MPQPGAHLEANDIPLANFNLPPIETPLVTLSRDDALHGGEEDDEATSIPEPTLPPSPSKRGIVQTFKMAVVSAFGANESKTISRGPQGQEVVKIRKAKDVWEVEQKDFAERRLTESKDKWDSASLEGLTGWQKFGKKAERFFDRTWRAMGSENAHRAKEKNLGVELSGIAGIDTAISEEFHGFIDQEARKLVKEERNTKGKQFWGGVKDAWAEFRGTRRDLHKYEIKVTQQLRQKYDADPSNPDPIANPLYALINRDVAAREALAARVNESDLELLHQTNAGDKKMESIKFEGEKGKLVEDHLKKEVIGKAIEDFVTRRQRGENVTGIDAKLRRELDIHLQNYWHSDEFQDWRKTLSADQQQYLESTMTYASDVLLQTEELMLPAVLDNLEHYQGVNRLDFSMELALGTAQLSANTEETSDGFFSKERSSLNQELMDKLRQDIKVRGTEASNLYTSDVLQKGLKNELLQARADMVLKNEMFGALIGGLAGKGIATLARAGMSWLPAVGSAGVAGTFAGLKEWGRMGKMRATYGFGTANGLEFPIADKAIRSAEMRAADYHRVQLGSRTQKFLEAQSKLANGSADNDTILMSMIYAADSTARLKLNGERNINLLTASVDGPGGRGIFARELRVHDKARAALMGTLTGALSDNAKMQEIGDMMGLAAGDDHTLPALMQRLTDMQYKNLLAGTQVDGSLKTLITAGDKELMRAKTESILDRDKIFNGMRWKSSLKSAAVSGVVAGVAGWGLGSFFNHEETITSTLTENNEVVVVNHLLPTHEDALTTAQIFDNKGNVLAETHSWLPADTHLELAQDRIGGPDDLVSSYNLVTDNTKDQVLLHGIQFGAHGEITNQTELATEMAENNIKIAAHELAPVGWGEEAVPGTTEIDYTQWDNTLHYGDFPGEDIHGFFAQNINASLAAHPEIAASGETLAPVERITDVTGLGNFMRGMENWVYKQENFQVNQIEGYNRLLHSEDTMWSELTGHKEVISEWQSNSTDILHVPDLLATEEGNRRVVDLIHEAVRENPTGDIHHQFSDEAHRIAWEMSYWGDEAHIPDANETFTLLEYFGEIPTAPEPGDLYSVTPIENYITIDQDVVTTVPVHTTEVFTQTVPDMWTSLATIGYSRPLEEPMGKSLRHVVTPLIPYGPYGKRSRVEDEYKSYYPGKEPNWSLYHERRSPTLNANPEAILNLKQEADWYLNTKINSEYKARIENLASQTEPMSENVKAVICMPVAAHQEESNIYNTLTRYTNQVDGNGIKLDPSNYEIFIYLNHPTNKTPDGTEREILRFKKDFPDVPVRIVKETLKPENVLWGKIVGALNDTVLMRSQQRANASSPDFVMLTNDADMTAIAPTYIDTFVKELEKPENAHVDGLLGKLEWSTEAYDKYPVFHAATRFWQYIDNITRNGTIENGIKRPNIGSPGATFGIRASSYAGIGGYIPETGAGADQELSWMIKAARSGDNSRDLYQDNYPIKMINRAWLESSPRRGLDYYLKGQPIVNQWADWDERAKNSDSARERKFVDILGRGESLNNFSSERLESEINALLNLYGYDADTPVVKKALALLGVSFAKDTNGKVKLVNIDKLLTGLKDFKDQNRSQVKKANNQAPSN